MSAFAPLVGAKRTSITVDTLSFLRCPLSGFRSRAIVRFHMQPTVIVCDLETVPDLSGFAAAKRGNIRPVLEHTKKLFPLGLL
jgi:hypothetical protein